MMLFIDFIKKKFQYILDIILLWKSLWDSHLGEFSFRQFSFKARFFLFISSCNTYIEKSEFPVSALLIKVDVEGPLTKIGWHYLLFMSATT